MELLSTGATTQVSYLPHGTYWNADSLLFLSPQNLETKVLSSYLAIADGAQLILDYCEEPKSGATNGQQFYEDGWNVIVRYNWC